MLVYIYIYIFNFSYCCGLVWPNWGPKLVVV